MTFRILRTRWQQHQFELAALRKQVFIEEQGVPEDLEWDDQDPGATHFLVFNDEHAAIATARAVAEANGCLRIGRFAVRADQRRRGVGATLLDNILTWARDQGYDRAVLSAQLSAVTFYEAAGFTPYGDTYLDAGIEHRSMVLPLSSTVNHQAPTTNRQIPEWQ